MFVRLEKEDGKLVGFMELDEKIPCIVVSEMRGIIHVSDVYVLENHRYVFKKSHWCGTGVIRNADGSEANYGGNTWREHRFDPVHIYATASCRECGLSQEEGNHLPPIE